MDNHKLLELFEERDGQFVSGEAISQELHVSRTAVWKQIRKLELLGYQFEASRKLGYKLVYKPDRLSEEELAERNKARSFGRSVTLLDEVDSTQEIARALAEEDAPEGTLVIAEQQVKGRGRMGREWVSPSGKGIWMSMVLRPQVPIHFAPQLTLVTAVALCRSLTRVTGLQIGIKWPNDLQINGKKISGILLESAAEDERLRYVIAGIGISANLETGDYPEEMLAKATSLRIQSGTVYDRTAIIADFMEEWEQLYWLYQREGFEKIAALWEALSVSLHRPAVLITPQGVVEGVPVGLHSSGAIIVEQSDGTRAVVFSADMGEPSA
ncbi:biotin--[acetyl-CoA-carboxylase] ligase [Paenibacillus protaetiae]|uniref:Bifunctional ligase/repressor BirA n=1 Tax=Paenibacillus protaetiae TaxID=2509456 RepID=A0A4P6ET95_9BACL|nr:biotin--[acetyl-CoA-carboxylase] ligase [Paenibacillus protaetiae]QAY66132.1 biotin--[acetyl-CoA-carboxylase] ligase [Paenibacillus protaetiae]